MAMSALSCMRVDTAHTERWLDGTRDECIWICREGIG